MPYAKDHKLRTRERIMQSATELFCRYGFDRVSIDQIMHLARMTRGAFYAYFESKEALYNESVHATLRRSRVARLAKAPFSIKHLTALVTDYLNLCDLQHANAPGPEAVLFNEIGSEHAEIRQVYEEAYARMRKILETRLTALARLGRLPFAADRDIIAQKARAILASLVGAVAIAKSISQEDEQREILAAAQRQILEMLGVEEDAGAQPGSGAAR
ncbi:TetR/AcrR family transcriptional regulator [Acidihalobacter ferrooxydans]|uniref:TetR family transcriptional regulator n=1 Tax=Acidihalobacter ferrooxydans TaxID=1765967 RepID=A0A1P8UJI5_9GAMM|nr:TetR/AcrR family transcriptional regulator [Acidihalobacter ferrooxydans]APZ43972.1 TetR family transcriptional regulator [Acidihalobacter ferrooxydans]